MVPICTPLKFEFTLAANRLPAGTAAVAIASLPKSRLLNSMKSSFVPQDFELRDIPKGKPGDSYTAPGSLLDCSSELKASRERQHAGIDRAGDIAEKLRVRHLIGCGTQLNPISNRRDAVAARTDFRMVENVIRLSLQLEDTLLASQRNILCERQIEVGHVRIAENARATSHTAQSGRPDDGVVRTARQSRHSEGRGVEINLAIAVRADAGHGIADHIAANGGRAVASCQIGGTAEATRDVSTARSQSA